MQCLTVELNQFAGFWKFNMIVTLFKFKIGTAAKSSVPFVVEID